MSDTPKLAALRENIKRLEQNTLMAVVVSEANMNVFHTGRQNRALFLFAKLIAHSMSMTVILDKFEQSSPGTRLLDHFSVAALTRTIIDASLMTMYVSEPCLSRNEWNLRRYVLYLHELTNRKRFLSALEDRDEAFSVSYPMQKASMIAKIQHFSACLSLSPSGLAELTSGQKVFVDGARGAVREAGWDVKQFEFSQSYLSAYVHSHPLSFMKALENHISFNEPSEYQYGLCSCCIQIAADLIDQVRRRISAFALSASDPLGQVDD